MSASLPSFTSLATVSTYGLGYVLIRSGGTVNGTMVSFPRLPWQIRLVTSFDGVTQAHATSHYEDRMGCKRNKTVTTKNKNSPSREQNLTKPMNQPTMGLLKQLADFRLEAIPCHRDRGGTPLGDQASSWQREVTSRPTAWSREVVEWASH